MSSSSGETGIEAESLRSSVTRSVARVEGWLHLDEAWALHEAARNLDTGGQPPTVVEIGSWKGRSTIAIALALKTRGAGTVFAIDPHTGAPGHTAVGPVITAEEFKHNITQANVESVVTLLVTTSHAARSQFGARSVDLLFIDGSHEYDDVVTDISDWESALKDESLVAFNDPSAPGVYRALRELVLRPGGAYRRPALIQNTLFFDFRRADPWTPQDARSLRRLRAVLELRFRAVPFWRFMPRWFVRMGHAVSRRLVSRRPYA